jgi:energy-coupling factor transporter ATP-binding protein EcfA2
MSASGPFRQSIAVVIGIDTYSSGIATLRTAANDARELGALLRSSHGYDVVELINENATAAKILALLQTELPSRVDTDDRVFFYFAGHGVARDGDDGPNGYLLPVDAVRGDETTYLQMPAVHDALLALTCRHMLVVLDSCFSGAFRWSGTRDVVLEEDVIHQEKYDRFVRDPAWQVITSASQDQKAIDQLSAGALGTRDGDGAHSPFAVALFDALKGAGDVIPRQGGDGLVTATELYLYLDETLQSAALAAGKKQTPHLWSLKKQDKGQYVFFVPGAALNLPPAPLLKLENNPWRGLASYEESDAALFFGRDPVITELRTKIEATPLTVVVGSSGSGKSSVVKAGVLPRLQADGWNILPVVRPGSTPLLALARALALPGAPAPGSTPAAITAALAKRIAAQPSQKTVLVVDQFQELITLARTAAERDQTLALLARLVDAHQDSLRVIVTIRTDFESNFDAAVFGTRWRDGRFVLPSMTREDLRAVIEQPAAKFVLYFDPSTLVDTLLDEIVATPGALPLLSFALSEMYVAHFNRRGGDRAITRADYDAVGGVVGALRSRAEAEYAALSDDAERATMRRIMLRLVTSDGGTLARRRAFESELFFANPQENARAALVVQRLTAARLLVNGQEPDGEPFVEPAHDALVRAWGRLLQWIRDEDAAPFPLAQQRRLSLAATEWERTEPRAKSGLLWSDAARSAQLAPLVRAKIGWWNTREMAFARRSIRGRRLAMAAAVGITVLIAASGLLSAVQWKRAEAARGVAVEQRGEAMKQRSVAIQQRAVAEAEKERALRSLFSSLRVSMLAGNPGSICVQPSCASAPPTDSGGWLTLSRLPGSLASVYDSAVSRDFIVAREVGRGHVLVYAHDGLTNDEEATLGGDNLLFAENALRWLGTTKASVGADARASCPAGPPRVLLWEGTYTPLQRMTQIAASMARRGWVLEPVTQRDSASVQASLRCAAVLWYLSDWYPAQQFGSQIPPLIKQFVRDGGGLLVGGLGWSYWENIRGAAPYPADVLGKEFGFAFTRDAFEAPRGRLIGLLSTP